MIEEIVPGNRTRLRIAEAIYENPGINLTSLIKNVKASPNLVLHYVNMLSSFSIIKEDKKKVKKKIHVRNLNANFDNEAARIIYSLVEINKRTSFFKKYEGLKSYFLQLGEIFKNKRGFALVYGSYARLAAAEDSDLDILIAGKFGKEEIKRMREVFVTLERELSLKVETVNSLVKNKDKPLYQNILKEHVVIHGAVEFIEFLNRVCY